MRPDPLAADCKFTPYWWDAGRVDLPALAEPCAELPERIDVAIVGGGYSGLSAALTLARAGHTVAVLDAHAPGFGCSSRNGGLVGPSLHRLGLAGLNAKYGARKADDILRESLAGLEFLVELIARERIDCHLVRSGRFRGAISARGYRSTLRGQRIVPNGFHSARSTTDVDQSSGRFVCQSAVAHRLCVFFQYAVPVGYL